MSTNVKKKHNYLYGVITEKKTKYLYQSINLWNLEIQKLQQVPKKFRSYDV